MAKTQAPDPGAPTPEAASQAPSPDQAAAPGKGRTENRVFEADVSRLLHLMVHSVYSDRDIFLRELVANGADACEKLRTLALQDGSLLSDGAELGVTLSATLTPRPSRSPTTASA